MKQSKIVQDSCNLLIDKVRFKTAHISLSDNRFADDTKKIREATRLYTETWIVPLLKAIRDGDNNLLRQALK